MTNGWKRLRGLCYENSGKCEGKCAVYGMFTLHVLANLKFFYLYILWTRNLFTKNYERSGDFLPPN